MSLEFVVILLIINYLRKNLQTAVTMPEWHKSLMVVLYVDVGLMCVQLFGSEVSSVLSTAAHWATIALLCLVIYTINKRKEFETARFFNTAVLPYIFVSVVSELVQAIAPKFEKEWHNWFDMANTFAVLWGLGVWLVTIRQRKELTKAREKAVKEEENAKVVTAMRDELEVQVAERTAEITKQKEALEETVKELQATQAQLIQSEKMASLGELTAGIAHEIQNPLNFVNNFSEVNNELIDELKSQRTTMSNEDMDDLLSDIFQNNEKIAFHGKRADAIVKGMLQHSRKNTGQTEPTDINALSDEYLRLSYHGLRAKDKTFNADFKTHFDESIGKIDVVPQDMGRVLLNLFNNAFYAVTDKRKDISDSKNREALEKYSPLVTVTTKKLNNEVEIIVADNGSGIPQNIIEKIFQPFFTTKPTGLGTGLGLSLAYDIVTKEHKGTVEAESTEGEGTRFIIHLPVT